MRRALIVGIDGYPNAPLAGCVNDANRMADILSKNQDGSPNFDCETLTSDVDEVTEAVLRKNLKALFAQKAEVALFYFAGHGMENKLGGHLMTQDSQSHDEGVPMQDVLALANQANVINEVVIILDCCQSGAFGRIPALQNEQAHLREGVSVLSASTPSESAVERDGGGLFTSLVCEALNGSAADLLGNVTVAGVYAYADKILGAWDQRPMFMAHVASLNSLRECKPAIDLAILRRLSQHFEDPDKELQLNPSFEPTSPSPDPKNTEVFADLQEYRATSLLVPIGTKHLYYAAMDSTACKLTPLGKFYWKLAKEEKI